MIKTVENFLSNIDDVYDYIGFSDEFDDVVDNPSEFCIEMGRELANFSEKMETGKINKCLDFLITTYHLMEEDRVDYLPPIVSPAIRCLSIVETSNVSMVFLKKMTEDRLMTNILRESLESVCKDDTRPQVIRDAAREFLHSHYVPNSDSHIGDNINDVQGNTSGLSNEELRDDDNDEDEDELSSKIRDNATFITGRVGNAPNIPGVEVSPLKSRQQSDGADSESSNGDRLVRLKKLTNGLKVDISQNGTRSPRSSPRGVVSAAKTANYEEKLVNPGSPWVFRDDKLGQEKEVEENDENTQPDTTSMKVDHSKLAAIKRLKRLNKATQQANDDEVEAWTANNQINTNNPLPKTSVGVRTGHSEEITVDNLLQNENNSQLKTPVALGPHTPIEVGLYGSNGTRSQRLRLARRRRAGATYRNTSEIPRPVEPSDAIIEAEGREGLSPSLDSLASEDSLAPKQFESRVTSRLRTNSTEGNLSRTDLHQHPPQSTSSLSSSRLSVSRSERDVITAEGMLFPPLHDKRLRQESRSETRSVTDDLEQMSIVEYAGTPSLPSIESRDSLHDPIRRRQRRSRLPVSSPRSEASSTTDLHRTTEKPAGMPNRSTILGTDNNMYLPSSQIHPSNNPTKELNAVLSGLGSQDWPEIFDTLTSVRRLGLHHQQVIRNNSSALHTIVKGLLKEVNNLRSAVSKNALLACDDLFVGMGRDMEPEVPALTPILLKKSCDSSIFLSSSAEQALKSMIASISVSKSIAILLASADHRHAQMRAKAALLLLNLIAARLAEIRSAKDIQAILNKLSKLVADQFPDARQSSREAVGIMYNSRLVSKNDIKQYIPPDMLERCLQASNERAVANLAHESTAKARPSSKIGSNGTFTTASPTPQQTYVMDSERDTDSDYKVGVAGAGAGGISRRSPAILQNTGSGSSTKPPMPSNGLYAVGSKAGGPAALTSSPSPTAKTAAKRRLSDTIEMQALPDLMKALNAKNWLERKNAIINLSDFICSHWETMRNMEKLDKAMDAILSRIDDGSVKVGLQAVSSLELIHKCTPTVIPSMLVLALPALLIGCSSSNRDISGVSSNLLWEVLAVCPVPNVLSQLCNISLHERDRLRATGLRVLGVFTLNNFPGQQDFIKKNIFPAVSTTILGNAARSEVRTAAMEVMRALQSTCRDPLWTWVPPGPQQDEIRRLLS